MSINFAPASARLTVLGSGWNNSSINSGNGLTENGKLWEDIAGDLGYDYGGNVDWDNISSGEDWTDQIITTDDGIRLISEWLLNNIHYTIKETAKKDNEFLKYAIDPNELKNIYGGLVSQELEWDKTDPARPHKYFPDVYYIQVSELTAYIFQEEAFRHYNANGGNHTVNDKSITIRTGSSMKVFWSECSTHFTDNYLPKKFLSIPIEYVCWQVLWGSFKEMLIAESDNVKTPDEVYNKTEIDGETYYELK